MHLFLFQFPIWQVCWKVGVQICGDMLEASFAPETTVSFHSCCHTESREDDKLTSRIGMIRTLTIVGFLVYTRSMTCEVSIQG
jgi:hypothetical protein